MVNRAAPLNYYSGYRKSARRQPSADSSFFDTLSNPCGALFASRTKPGPGGSTGAGAVVPRFYAARSMAGTHTHSPSSIKG
jgi:hypothetical protein